MSDENADLPAGTLLGPYELEGVVGAGGMATVYLARTKPNGALVAIKALHKKFATVPMYVERFAREARAASALRHPHVIEVLDVRTDAERPFIVMEYLAGETLADRLLRVDHLSADVAAQTLVPVVSAVSAAHAMGVLHRDLKPDNIILARTETGERPVLLDFGISKMLEGPKSTALTQAGQVIGTPYYMSPEQIRSEELDVRSDVYALGVILYECVTGTRPYRAEQSVFVLMAEILLGQPVLPSHLVPGLPPLFEALVLHAMAPRREDRFASADLLGRALLPFVPDTFCQRWAASFGMEPENIERISVPTFSGPIQIHTSLSPFPSFAVVDPSLVTQPAVPAPRADRSNLVSGADLRVIAGLAELSEVELDAFCQHTPARMLAPDALVFSQGESGDSSFALIRGNVELSKTLDGTGMVMGTLGPGALIGQDALAERTVRTVTARAVSECVVIELSREDLHRALGFHDRVALRLLELIAISGIQKLRSGTKKLAELLEARGLGRVAEESEGAAARPLEQLRAALREWSVDITER